MKTLRSVFAFAVVFAGLAVTPTDEAEAANTGFLPTDQLTGIARSSDSYGDTAYVGGLITSTRPSGKPRGVNESPRHNLLSISLSTGKVTTWAPKVNGEIKAVRVSKTGRYLAIGGSFTQVDGQPRENVAIFNRSTGKLTNFRAKMSSTVLGLDFAPNDSRIYTVGWSKSANGIARPSGGIALTMSGAVTAWNPRVTGGTLMSVGAAMDGKTVLVGGSMESTVGASPGNALAIVDPLTGMGRKTQANDVIRVNHDTNIGSIRVNSYGYYATSWSNSPGYTSAGLKRVRYEGVVRLGLAGNLIWQSPSRGDKYDVFARGSSVLVAGHPHDMSNVGGPGEAAGIYYRATAYSVTPATKKITAWSPFISTGWASFGGYSRPWTKGWYPALDMGTESGQNQGPWTVTGNTTGSVVLYAGEFPRVNGATQEGLVRFNTPIDAASARTATPQMQTIGR